MAVAVNTIQCNSCGDFLDANRLMAASVREFPCWPNCVVICADCREKDRKVPYSRDLLGITARCESFR